jgi:histidine decarboxylase
MVLQSVVSARFVSRFSLSLPKDQTIPPKTTITMESYQRTPVNAAFDAYLDEMDHLESEVASQKPMLGYPLNCHENLPLLPLHATLHRDSALNNCGDPFDNAEKPWKLNTLKQEGILLRRLMEPWGGNSENSWGYITTGGTEGVTKGFEMGYGRLRSRGYKNILLVYSKAAHYCVPKAATFVAHTCNKVSVDVSDTNSMKLGKLDDVLHSAQTLGVDAILLCCTLGTTFFGGCDDVEGIRSLLMENGYGPKSFYIHIDAALHGGFWKDDKQTPKYQIGKHFDSISISGHKWFGGFIAGCFMATNKGAADSAISHGSHIEYVEMVDKFISGSRSGAAAVLWMARLLQFDWQAELDRCHSNRDYLVNELRSLGLKVASQYVNVLMPRPSEELAKKWQLMCVGDEAQILLLPHAARQFLEEFVDDVKKEIEAGNLRLPTARLIRLAELQSEH